MVNVIYLPGCSFERNEKHTSLKVFEYLESICDKAIYYKLCCGAISETFNFEDNIANVDNCLHKMIVSEDIDLVITQCASCYNYYKNNCSDELIREKTISIYEIIDSKMVIDKDYKQKKINIHDPCTARYCSEMYTSVRSILEKMNYDIEEIKYSKNLTKCCGNGAMLGFTSQRMKRKFLKERQAEFSYDIVTYCSHCQKTLKNSYHILNLLFKEGEE